MKRKTPYNSTYPKVAVQWLNETLCPPAGGFSTGSQFSASKSAYSPSAKTLALILDRP